MLFLYKMAGRSVPEDETRTYENEKVPEWVLASEGIKLIINNNSEEAVNLFLRYPNSLVMFSGYAVALFMDALMSFEEEKLSKAISILRELENRCDTDNGWLRSVSRVFGGDPKPKKSLAEQLETQIILADSQVCIAMLTFLQQDISGYFKGGWVLRKAWKVYQKVYKEICQLYREIVGEVSLPDLERIPLTSPSTSQLNFTPAHTNGYNQYSKVPHSKSATLHTSSNGSDLASHTNINCPTNKGISKNRQKSFSAFKKSSSVNSGLVNNARGNRWSLSFSSFNSSFPFYNLSSPLNLFSSQDSIKDSQIDREDIIRLMEAVTFGYGLFQLGISLLPPSLTKLTSMLGFGANRQDALACLMYARLGTDMRAPLATLALLWYHTIVRPFYAIDGTNVQAGADASTLLLRECQAEFKDAALFLFFRGRVCRLNSDITSALLAFQQATDNAKQREIKILCLHETGWCHLIELDYRAAESVFLYLKASSRWSRSFYAYLAAICAGACQINMNFLLFEDVRNGYIGVPKGTQLEEFLSRRTKYCPYADDNTTGSNQKKTIFWKLLVFEMLYLWNALPSCSMENIEKVINDCQEITDEEENDEPMRGLSKLILGCAFCVRGSFEDGIMNFRKCLDLRKNMATNAEDAHVSAFAHYELGALLIRREETKEEGKLLLQQVSHYSKYDFQQKLDVRVYSILKSL